MEFNVSKFQMLVLGLFIFIFPISSAFAQQNLISNQTNQISTKSISDSIATTQNQTLNVSTSETFLTSSPLSAATPSQMEYLGVSDGTQVNGVLQIRPNTDVLTGIRKVSYYLNGAKSGKVYQSPFIWGGVNGNGTAGFDTKTIQDGSYILNMVYTNASGDHEINIHFIVNNTTSTPLPDPNPEPTLEQRQSVEILDRVGFWDYNPMDVTAQAQQAGIAVTQADFDKLYSIAQAQQGTQTGNEFYQLYEPYYMVYQSGNNMAIAISTSSRDQYRYGCPNGCVQQIQDGGAYTIFLFKNEAHPEGVVIEWNQYLKSDTAYSFSPQNELVVRGTWSSSKNYIFNQDGKLIATADQTIPAGSNPPPPPPTSPMIGIQNGQTVSGVVNFGPNLNVLTSVKKVAYYLNGTQFGKSYSAPFIWGGSSGFDTRTLLNGPYTLSGAYTDLTGDHSFSVTFQIQN